MPLLQKIECVCGDIQEILFAGSVLGDRSLLSTCFSSVAQCGFSGRIWRNLMESCLVSDPFVEWNDIAKGSMEVLQGKIELAN
jgi:hypothetical protein